MGSSPKGTRIASVNGTTSTGGVVRMNSIVTFLVGFFSAIVFLGLFGGQQQIGPSSLSSMIPADVQTALLAGHKKRYKFKGEQYWKEGFTQKVITLYETTFARFQLHQIQLEDGKTIINDWMWYDESDNINVLVETIKGTYLVFQQTKYAFNGQSYAVVGGLIEPGEQPLEAAKRELQEELGMQAGEWKSLGAGADGGGGDNKVGAFRAAANRGGGMTYPFLASKAVPIPGMEQKSSTTGGASTIAEGEAEHQSLLELTREELYDALLQGKFQEIKWTATVALAMLTGETKE